MLQESVNGVNRISGVTIRMKQEKINGQSPYIAQLRSFQQRFRSKSLKQKNNKNSIRKQKDQNKVGSIDQQQIMRFAKNIINKNYNCLPFFEIDKQNYIETQTDSQKVCQADLLFKIREKIYDSKKQKLRNQEKALPQYTIDSVPNGHGFRLSSYSNIERDIKVRKFNNEISFLKYKKNKNVYSIKYQ